METPDNREDKAPTKHFLPPREASSEKNIWTSN